MSQPSRRLMRAVWRLHRFWYRVSGGRIGTKMSGLPILELTTTGRSTGQARSVMLAYLEDPRGFIVIASNAGSDNDPAWWKNLEVQPSASVRTGRTLHDVRMRQLEGDERADALSRAAAAYSGYADYATKARRTIPVALLEMEPGSGS